MRSFDWYPWTSVDHLLIASDQDLTYSRGFCSIIPVTTDPESQPRAARNQRREERPCTLAPPVAGNLYAVPGPGPVPDRYR